MFSSPVDEIKNRLDLVEVIGGYIKLSRAGANYRALCPFHSEKKPSLFVSPARQIWHCFGCSKGGNIFNFIMEIEGVEFGDALRILAQKAGVELKRQDPKLKTERKRLYEICELACQFFEKQLRASRVGQEAREYLMGRGIKEESLKKWRIGYSPDTWGGLVDFLVGEGYKREEAERAGLAVKAEQGNFYDRFRGRIIFPICDLNSQVIGFGGRVFKTEDLAKYVNTPNTPLYDKSRILYGLDKAKVEIRKKDFCILVEGYTDAIMCSQTGFENVVAVSGTALTPAQLKLLKRYSENLLTAFDMDIAGDSATKRGIDLAQSQGFNIKVITMPSELDPADIISQDLGQWSKLVEGASSILAFYFETTFSRFDQTTAEGKEKISRVLLPIIKRIPNQVVKAHWIQELAGRLGVKEEIIQEELKRTSPPQLESILDQQETLVSETKKSRPRKERLEERIIALILRDLENLKLIDESSQPLFSAKMQAVLTRLQNSPNLETLDLGEFNYLFLEAESEEEEKNFELEIKSCLGELKKLEVKNKLDQLSRDLKKAEEEKNFEKVDQLIQKFNQLANQLT